MEKYIFIHDEDFHWYMIPLKLREQFNELLYGEDMNEFNNVFQSFYLETHISNTPFYLAEEVERMDNFPIQLPEGIPYLK